MVEGMRRRSPFVARPHPTSRQQAAAVLGMTGLAVSQPVLAMLGDTPSLFTFHDLRGAAIVMVGVAVVVVPALAVWAIGLAVSRINSNAGYLVHLASIGVLATLAASQWLQALGSSAAAITSGASLLAGLLLVAAYARWSAVARWLRYCAIVPGIALGLFVFGSPSSGLVTGSEQDVTLEDRDVPPVVMIVVDELPTLSLLDHDGGIDDRRFPNLAAFAEDATWYRNHTTVAPKTRDALPALLTGSRSSVEEPLWSNYPDNLFSLLAPTHDLVAFETVTALCGVSTCQTSDTADAPSTAARFSRALATTADLYRERVDPRRTPSARLDSFEEDVVPPDPTEVGVAPTTESVQTRPRRLDAFVDLLEQGERPQLSFLHLLLPHFPWRFHADGSLYEPQTSIAAEDYPFSSSNDRGDWIAAITEQRHLLQASYTDGLVGSVLSTLEERGLYEESLVVVVSDHGVSFASDTRTRELTAEGEGLAALAYSPLLVKLPGQQEGEVSDANVMIVDVLPTIAQELDLEIPWDVEGVPIGSEDLRRRGDEKFFIDAVGYVTEPRGVKSFTIGDTEPRIDDRWIGPLEDPTDRLRGLHDRVEGGDLVGRSIDELPSDGARGRAEVNRLAALRQPGTVPVPPGIVSGRVVDPPSGGTVLVAVDGTVVAASPVYDDGANGAGFSALLPSDALGERNEITLLHWDGRRATELDLEDGAP